MEQFKNIKQQLLREYGIKVSSIREFNNYSQSYIGLKIYQIEYEHPKDGTKWLNQLPADICHELWSGQVDWGTVNKIAKYINGEDRYQKAESVDYRPTSNKRRTRKEWNKVKVKGYYDSINN